MMVFQYTHQCTRRLALYPAPFFSQLRADRTPWYFPTPFRIGVNYAEPLFFIDARYGPLPFNGTFKRGVCSCF
jgi:hypothetical protein